MLQIVCRRCTRKLEVLQIVCRRHTRRFEVLQIVRRSHTRRLEVLQIVCRSHTRKFKGNCPEGTRAICQPCREECSKEMWRKLLRKTQNPFPSM